MSGETELTVRDIYVPPLKLGVTLNRTVKKDLQTKEARRLYFDSYVRLLIESNFNPCNFPAKLTFYRILIYPKINFENNAKSLTSIYMKLNFGT